MLTSEQLQQLAEATFHCSEDYEQGYKDCLESFNINNMNHKEREALQKIAKLNSNYKLVDALSIATEALEQSEPRMFSEDEVRLVFQKGLNKGLYHDSSYITQPCLWEDECIQSLSPKEGKEKGIALMQDGVSMDYDNSSLEPNQIEVEKETIDWEQFIIDQINQSYNEHKGSNEAVQDAAYFITKKIESNLSLARKQVIKEIEGWMNELKKNSIEPITHLTILYNILLTKLSKLK